MMPTCDTCDYVRLSCSKTGAAISQSTGCSFHEYKGEHFKLTQDEADLLHKLLMIGSAACDGFDNDHYHSSLETVFNNLAYKLAEQYGFDPVYC